MHWLGILLYSVAFGVGLTSNYTSARLTKILQSRVETARLALPSTEPDSCRPYRWPPLNHTCQLVFTTARNGSATFAHRLPFHVQGRIFLSPNLLAFYSNHFGTRIAFTLSWEDIEEIKERTTPKALMALQTILFPHVKM